MLSKRRVLHLIPSFGPGGAERQLAYLCAGLVRRGVDVHVGYVHGGPNLARLEQSGATAHRLPARSNYDPRLLPRISKLVRSIRPDIIQTWNPMMDVLGATVSRLARVPWVLSERNVSSSFSATPKMRARTWLARHADAIVSNSRSGDAFWAERLGTAIRTVIPNALPLDEIAACPRADDSVFEVAAGTPLILYVGRLDPQKNIDTLLSSLELAVAQCDAVACLLGEGPLRARVDAHLRREPSRNHIFAPGYVENVWGWMKAADVIVSVSHFEGMPNTVMEAMACGRPLVVSDIAPHREILAVGEAHFVPVADAQAIGHALVDCLTRPEAAAERASRAERRCRQWSIEAIAGQWERIYDQTLETARAEQLGPAS